MNEQNNQLDISKEKKKNRNLAIGVGVLGLGAFALFYIFFIAVMIVQPGLMFKLIPTPSITDEALSDGDKTYLLYQKVDMSNVNPQEKRQPEIKHFLIVLDGKELGASEEIPAFEHAFGARGRLVFLSKGGFRSYDGVHWVEESSDAIGKDPRGILTPDGLYVLSNFEAESRLMLIESGMAKSVPLPNDYLAAEKKNQCSCAKLVWYQGRLCLFWTTEESISWVILSGSTWSPTATSPFSGGYEVIAEDRNLYFFHREGEGSARILSYYIFANDAWSGPMLLPIQGGFTDWDVFFQQGKLKLYTQQFMNQTLYTVEQGSLVDPIRLKGPFNPASMMGRMALFIACINVMVFLIVSGFSALINKFKKTISTENGIEYEFASLFRRFLAIMIDNLLLLVPPAIVIALLLPRPEDIAGHPLRFLSIMFSVICIFFVGGYLYHSLLEGLFGQTLGKKLCGIRVLKGDFTPCGLSDGFLRNLLRIVDAFSYYLVAAISLAGTFKWQRIGDMVANTVVVRNTPKSLNGEQNRIQVRDLKSKITDSNETSNGLRRDKAEENQQQEDGITQVGPTVQVKYAPDVVPSEDETALYGESHLRSVCWGFVVFTIIVGRSC